MRRGHPLGAALFSCRRAAFMKSLFRPGRDCHPMGFGALADRLPHLLE